MIRLALRVRSEHAELVLAELLELAPRGVEELARGEEVEYALYGAPGELPELPDLRAAAGDALVEVHTSEIGDDWAHAWRRFHRPVLIESPDADSAVPALHVRPPWEDSSPPGEMGEGALEDLVIDPGQAFGTGSHATTQLCLSQLLALAALSPERGGLLDIGTGSGILAIAAARLGFEPVLALDHDPQSIAAARSNAAANCVEIDVRRLDVRREPLPQRAGRFRVVLANLLAPLLLVLARALCEPPEHLLLGGLLVADAAPVAQAFRERLAMVELERRVEGEWASLWLATAPAGARAAQSAEAGAIAASGTSVAARAQER